jgi:hypothetical protein
MTNSNSFISTSDFSEYEIPVDADLRNDPEVYHFCALAPRETSDEWMYDFVETKYEDSELYFYELQNQMEEEFNNKQEKVEQYSVTNPKDFQSLHLEATEHFYSEGGFQDFSSEYPSTQSGYHEALDRAIYVWCLDYIYNAI